MTEYRPEIDGLRAVAVTAVVLYHLGVPGVTGGFVGVDVFFVISGYVITWQLWSHRGESLGAFLAGFYARRARRIVPALALVVVATLALAKLLLLPYGEQQDLARSGIAAGLFIANINFRFAREEYFTQPAELQPLLHTWSLAVEEQFYLVWPLLLGLLWMLSRRGVGRAAERIALTAVAGLTIASLAVAVEWTRADPRAAFFLLPARFWELGVGATLALWVRARGPLPWPAPVAALGLAGIVAAVFVITPATPFPGFAAMLPVAATALVIAAGERDGLARRFLASRPMTFTGTVSYSWYLWHWPLLAIVRCLNLGAHAPVVEAIAVVAAYGLACLSTFYLELPIRNKRWRFAAGTGPALATGAVCMLGMAFLSGLLWLDARARYQEELLPVSNACMQSPGVIGIEDPAACTLTRGPAGTVFLLGDSHAAHWAPAIAAWARSAGLTALERSYAFCLPPIPAPAGYYAGCNAFSRTVMDEIAASAASKRPTFVIVAGSWPRHRSLLEEPVANNRASHGLEALQRLGVPTLVIADTPRFPWPVAACVARAGEASCRTSRAAHDAENAASLRVLRTIAASHPGIQVLDPTPAFCDAQWCYPVRGGTLVFRDESHLTRAGAEQALGTIRPGLDALAAVPANR